MYHQLPNSTSDRDLPPRISRRTRRPRYDLEALQGLCRISRAPSQAGTRVIPARVIIVLNESLAQR